MSETDMKDRIPGVIQAGGSGFETLTVTEPEAIEIIARLRETQGDVRGRAFIVNLDQIIVRLGAKWEVKQGLVHEHLRKSFMQKLQEPNWCAQLQDNLWVASTIAVGSRQGALKCAEIWHEAGQFFVGDISDTRLPLFEILVEEADRLKLRQIDLNTFFDRDEDFGPKSTVRPLGVSGQDAGTDRTSQAVGTMTAMNRPILSSSTISIGGKDLHVACSVEPVFELKNLSMIGHRLEPVVIDRTGNVQLDSKALKGMDWGDREKVDLANIEQGLQLLRSRSPGQRKILIVVPVAFSTMASARSRNKAIADVSKAASDMDMKVLYEIRGLAGVPSHRILEVISLIKPYCMTVVGHVGSELRAIQAVRQCGFSGVCVTYDGVERSQTVLEDYLKDLSVAAKASAGACMVQGLDNLRQMAVARLAGVSHASVKASALQATGARY
jgi:hypothetical protein